MTRVIEADLNPKRMTKPSSVGERTMTGPDGKRFVASTVSGDSKTLARDMTYVFARNVARARRDSAK